MDQPDFFAKVDGFMMPLGIRMDVGTPTFGDELAKHLGCIAWMHHLIETSFSTCL